MVAVTLVAPEPVLVARPVGVTAATFALEDVQVTQGVTSLVVPSLKSAKAVNCVKPPGSRLIAAGDTTSAMGVAPVTVKEAVPICPPNSAPMIVVPGVSPVASPL